MKSKSCNKAILMLISCVLLINLLCSLTVGAQSSSPHFMKTGNRTQLIVNDQPFLSFAGELHNSSSSDLAYMERLWPTLKRLNLNTVLAPVSWELVEPVEGQYDFSLIDGLITQARQNNMKLVFLWFGSWKNLVSTYAPAWVKTNPKRFPLFYNVEGKKYQMLSAFSEENWKADARAYAALMNHIKQIDSKEQTVIMMQVENEVGTDFGHKDCSGLATKAYERPVPQQLISYLKKNKSDLIPEFKELWEKNGSKTNGNWKEIFGEGTPCNEIFMAWHLAYYIGKVIEAGKVEYDIPMFVNAAIGRNTLKPASYPSGGPVPFVMDVWYAAAPQLDMLTPDIYYGDFNKICEQYTLSGNPLYIPETRAGISGAANAMITFCNFNGIGFSPFGIEGYETNTPNNSLFAQTYDYLQKLSPLLLNKGSRKQMVAVSSDTTQVKSVVLGKYKVDYKRQGEDLGFAMLIELNPDEYIVAGHNITIEFSIDNRKKEEVTGILFAEEGLYENNRWIPERRMNGDQIMLNYSFPNLYEEGKSGNGLRFRQLGMQRVKLYRY
jgi:hypothetical protein